MRSIASIRGLTASAWIAKTKSLPPVSKRFPGPASASTANQNKIKISKRGFRNSDFGFGEPKSEFRNLLPIVPLPERLVLRASPGTACGKTVVWREHLMSSDLIETGLTESVVTHADFSILFNDKQRWNGTDSISV